MPPEFDWPATPDVAPAVLARIDPRRPRRRRIAALAAAVVLVPAAGATAYRWLDLDSVEVRREPPPTAVPTPAPRDPITLPQAERLAGFTPLVPRALGAPDAIYYSGGVVTLDYGDVRLEQLRGAFERELVQKFIGNGTDVRAVPGGAFIEGRHFYLYLRPDGSIREGRTAASTLIVERGDLLLRLEGEGLTYERAQRLLGPP
jgi:hypothetical protein